MEKIKWLQRKYPVTFKELNEYFNESELFDFKNSTLKIGRLTKDIRCGQKYKKGSIIEFKRSNPVTNHNHPIIYATIKCQPDYTLSGYHSITISEYDFEEILK